LTVLFCELVGSTRIAAQLDPEEWRELVAGHHRAAAEAISRFGGHVAKYLGDGVMAYFGWPEAHENDAERAARAGLAILEGVSKLNQQSTNPEIAVRVGIDSGAVVIGASAGKDADVFGETPNIAARVQTAAAPDTVLITSATHRLLSGLFVVEESGAHQLKGVSSPIELYRVLRPTGVRSRIGARGVTPFIGREEELRLLLSRWQQVREGEGQVVLVIGEAGIGKSRLIAEFRERIRDTPHTWVESAGEQLSENSPFHAITEMLEQWLELNAGTNVGEHIDHLERALALAGLKVAEAAPLIGGLLQLPLGERYPPLTLTPEQKRRRLLASLAEWLFGAASLQPVVMVVEDLHWLDPSTLDLQQILVEQGATARLMLLYTARPQFRAPWVLRAHHTQVTLNRLSTRNVRNLVLQVVAHEGLSEETLAAVVERTGGVPLFVEELTRVVLESGRQSLAERTIPATLHDSLMARLDGLGPAKEILQIGAVIGAEFSYQLLREVRPIAEPELERALRAASNAELLYARGVPPEATYRFKHALIRDAAYEALLRSRRKELHRLIAQNIDEKFLELKKMHPEMLARHWAEAGETERAIAEWLKAGKRGEACSAFEEAQASYRQALALLDLLPESPERDLQELELQQSLIRLLFISRGYTGREAIEAADRAATLAEKSGNLRKFVNLIVSRGISAAIGGDLRGATEIADRALELGSREGSPSIVGRAHLLQQIVRFYRGDLVDAERHFTEGLRFFGHPAFRRVPGAAIAAFNYGAVIAWLSGRADLSRNRMAQMMAAADEDNPFDLAFSGQLACELQAWTGAHDEAEASALRALGLAEKHQFREIAAGVRCILGMTQARLKRATDSVSLIRNALAELQEMGERLPNTWLFLANAYECTGAIANALETVNQTHQQWPDMRVYQPEILRMRGELQFKKAGIELAEADFRESLALAQSMGAKAWELRSTMSLGRLLASNGRRDEAHSRLADIYNWFTEGFDTADLKDAKALLDELSA
jgi:class 3 adenylate cyclase/tetratricopeptide (TPR) repeat protein